MACLYVYTISLYAVSVPPARLSIAIQRGNAAAVLGTAGTSGKWDP